PLCNETSVFKPGLSASVLKRGSTNPTVDVRRADGLQRVRNLHAVNRMRAGIGERYIGAVPIYAIVVIEPMAEAAVEELRADLCKFGDNRAIAGDKQIYVNIVSTETGNREIKATNSCAGLPSAGIDHHVSATAADVGDREIPGRWVDAAAHRHIIML